MVGQGAQQTTRFALDETVVMMFSPMPLLGVQCEQFPPAGDQGGQALLGGTVWRGGCRAEKLPIFGEDDGIQPIGFGEQSLGAGKGGGMAWIEENDWQRRLV